MSVPGLVTASSNNCLNWICSDGCLLRLAVAIRISSVGCYRLGSPWCYSTWRAASICFLIRFRLFSLHIAFNHLGNDGVHVHAFSHAFDLESLVQFFFKANG